MKAMNMQEIVMKLVGPVRPVGETNTDNERFENLKELVQLTDNLLTEINRIAADNYASHEFSRARVGKYCSDFYTKIGIVE